MALAKAENVPPLGIEAVGLGFVEEASCIGGLDDDMAPSGVLLRNSSGNFGWREYN